MEMHINVQIWLLIIRVGFKYNFVSTCTCTQWRRKLIKTRGANLCNYVHLQIGERNIWATYILYDYDSMSI